MIAIVDDGTCFAHTLAGLVAACGVRPRVVPADGPSNDVLTVPDALIVAAARLAPPVEEYVHRCLSQVPTLAVGYGMRWLALRFGASLQPRPAMYGKADQVVHDGSGLFAGLPSPLQSVRYDAWAVEPDTLPTQLQVAARSAATGDVLALRHASLPVTAVQFYPHSALSQRGRHIIDNFVREGARSHA